MFFKDFVSVKRQKIKRGASQTYDTPSLSYREATAILKVLTSARVHKLSIRESEVSRARHTEEIAGVIYACGNINVNIGKNSRLNLTGSMVAYGSDPQKNGEAIKSKGKGNIYYKAKSVEMTFDPNYINKLLAMAAQRKVKVRMFANY